MKSARNNVRVGISQRVDIIDFYGENRDSLDQKMVDWVVAAGFVPIPIPNVLVDEDFSFESQPYLRNWLEELNVNALLLSGGNDIGDIPKRDLTENFLLYWAKKNEIPVLGVCRGMQMMAIWSGSELVKVDGHVRTRHQLQVADDDQLQKLPDSVNSFHKKALKECPDSFKILARSNDGNIEAIVHKNLPWEAWMWHPEREKEFMEVDIERFKNLISSRR
jgi:putative glutamine amidotransferase